MRDPLLCSVAGQHAHVALGGRDVAGGKVVGVVFQEWRHDLPTGVHGEPAPRVERASRRRVDERRNVAAEANRLGLDGGGGGGGSVGTSPLRRIGSCSTVGSAVGIADSSALVYGCCGLSKTCSTEPVSR